MIEPIQESKEKPRPAGNYAKACMELSVFIDDDKFVVLSQSDREIASGHNVRLSADQISQVIAWLQEAKAEVESL